MVVESVPAWHGAYSFKVVTANQQGSTAGGLMLCAEGTELLHDFERAVQARAEARDILLSASGPSEAFEDILFAARLSYGRAFVAWVTHRGICIDCRTTSIKDDLAQFASV